MIQSNPNVPENALFIVDDSLLTLNKCKNCKYYYRKPHERGHKSWGKCELGRGGYDVPANHLACTVYEEAEK